MQKRKHYFIRKGVFHDARVLSKQKEGQHILHISLSYQMIGRFIAWGVNDTKQNFKLTSERSRFSNKKVPQDPP